MVDANFQNGFLWGKFSSGKAVDIDFAAIGPCRWSCQLLEFGGQIIGVVGKGLQRLAFQNNTANIVFWADAELLAFALDGNLLLFHGHSELGVHNLRVVRGNLKPGLCEGGKALDADIHGVRTGCKIVEGIAPLFVGLRHLC